MKHKNFISLFKMLLEISGSHKKEYLKSLTSGIFAIIFEGLIYVSFYFLLSNLINGYEIWLWLSTMVILGVAQIILKFKSTYYDHGGTFINVGRELREKLGRKLISVPLSTLHRYKTGDLNAVISSNVGEAVMFMNMIPLMALELIIVSAVVIIVTFFVSAKIALLMLVMLPVALFLYKLRRNLAIEEKSEFVLANADLEGQIIEYIQGIGVLRSVNKTGENAQNLQAKIENVRKIQLKAMALANIPTLALGSIAVIIMCVGVFFGVYLQNLGEISVAIVAGVLVILSRLSEPFSIFLSVSSIFDLIDSAFLRTKEILNLKDLQILKPNLTPQNLDIEFENVSFSYENDGKFALKNLNFKIRQNTLTAFVGTSGGGKSTATKMLMRYDDPQIGAVKIGGANIKNMSQNELLSHLSFVFQDVYLFNDTILNNIKFARMDATDEEILNAAKMAHCDEFISRLPQGFHTIIGDVGGELSGGEKQRIGIARAILKNAPIVVLDEPTAALDTVSEVAVQKAIDALVADKTLIIIAHRLSTIVRADQILVFDNGEIIERGTHEELLRKGGKYSKMWHVQGSS